jgi:hypothetical protein
MGARRLTTSVAGLEAFEGMGYQSLHMAVSRFIYATL